MPLGKAGMIRGYGSVGHYIQGPGAVQKLPEIALRCGRSAVMVIDSFFEEHADQLKQLFSDSTLAMSFQIFRGECSDEEIERLKGRISGIQPEIQVAIGFGGGKTLDTVRVIAARMGLKMILVPTSAASNAATSGLSVVYDEHHVGRSEFLYRNPDYVIADTDYIIAAPARMLASGIGDSMATYFEARNNYICNNINTVMPGYHSTICGRAVAKVCYETLMESGIRAYHAAQAHFRTEDFEDVVEGINLLSGIGWENNGCSVAHGLAAAVPIIPETKNYMHGECVAYCLLTQLILDRVSNQTFEKVRDLFIGVSLPVRLKEIGIEKSKEEKVRCIIKQAFETQKIMRIVNYPIDSESVYQAMMYVDSLA